MTSQHAVCSRTIGTSYSFARARRRERRHRQQRQQWNMMFNYRPFLLSLLLLLLLLLSCCVIIHSKAEELSQREIDRLVEYNKRNYTWPIPKFVPNTLGWRKLYDHRLRQVSEITDNQQRYEGYAQTLSSCLIAPNYTTWGFGVVRAPHDLMVELKQAIHEELDKYRDNDGNLQEDLIPTEPGIHSIEGSKEPWFMQRPELTNKVLHELLPYVETWAKIELLPSIAYGFRFYRDGSSLGMHIDRSYTHVISFILHIDSSEDSEPWPITIEDFNGETHEVVLTSGDMLLYESSKCFHGRPRKFKGTWYTSVFVHYYPKYNWRSEEYYKNEKLYAIPPHWIYPPNKMKYEIPVELVGTSFKEPSCPNNWCLTQYSHKWSGPGPQDGYWLTPTQELLPFHPHAPCDDIESIENCQSWIQVTYERSGENECHRNPGYMLYYCKKSCGVCDNNAGDDESSTKSSSETPTTTEEVEGDGSNKDEL